MAQIVVLTHEYDHFPGRSYMLRTLFRSWGRSGHSIEIVRGMPDDARGDVAIQHVDCSVVPPDYFAFATRFPVVINGIPRDIRKRTISRLLVSPGDGWVGPVIVKSNLNFSGILRKPTLADFRVSIAGIFVERSSATGRYELADRCRTFVLDKPLKLRPAPARDLPIDESTLNA